MSPIDTEAENYPPKMIYQALKDSGATPSEDFSMYLATSEHQSMLTFGGTNPDLMRDGSNAVIHRTSLLNNEYWSVEVSGLTVNKNTAWSGEAQFAIVDSGTTLLALTPDDFSSTMRAIGGSVKGHDLVEFEGGAFQGWPAACSEI